MGSRTKILDFYGLPACGKSSLVSFLLESGFPGMTVADKRLALQGNRLSVLLRFIRSLRFRDLRACVRYHNSIPKEKRRKGSSLRQFVKNYGYYRYFARFSGYDLVCLDNGIVQSVVSHQRGHDLIDEGSYRKSVKEMITLPIDITYVWCDVDPSVSLTRMHQRGRKKGRIDLMEDEHLQLASLEQERQVYLHFTDFIREAGRPVITVNCNQAVEEEAAELKRQLAELWK